MHLQLRAELAFFVAMTSACTGSSRDPSQCYHLFHALLEQRLQPQHELGRRQHSLGLRSALAAFCYDVEAIRVDQSGPPMS